jgi:ferredoxin
VLVAILGGLSIAKINKFQFKDARFLRNKVVHDKSDKLLVFVQTHNPKNPHVFNYLRNAFNSLIATNKFADIFKDTKLIKSLRQPQNLGRSLQKHNIFIDNVSNGSVKCNGKICGTCNYILTTDTVHFYNHLTKEETDFKLYRPFSCLSTNVIYKISCKGCSLFYIGQTVNLRNRVTKHKYDLRHPTTRLQKLHIHIHECAASNYEYPFTIVPFYYVRQCTTTAMLTIEDYFIRKFQQTLNAGF